jgi:hypothetical protein
MITSQQKWKQQQKQKYKHTQCASFSSFFVFIDISIFSTVFFCYKWLYIISWFVAWGNAIGVSNKKGIFPAFNYGKLEVLK